MVTEAGGADSTLVSDFQLKYTLSQKANLSTNTSIGEVVINVPFESSEVKFIFSTYGISITSMLHASAKPC